MQNATKDPMHKLKGKNYLPRWSVYEFITGGEKQEKWDAPSATRELSANERRDEKDGGRPIPSPYLL